MIPIHSQMSGTHICKFTYDSEKWSFRRSSIIIPQKVCAVGFEPAYCNLEGMGH